MRQNCATIEIVRKPIGKMTKCVRQNSPFLVLLISNFAEGINLHRISAISCLELLLISRREGSAKVSMDLSPIRQNFEKNRNRQKFHNSLKEHPMFSEIAKFGCEML